MKLLQLCIFTFISAICKHFCAIQCKKSAVFGFSTPAALKHQGGGFDCRVSGGCPTVASLLQGDFSGNYHSKMNLQLLHSNKENQCENHVLQRWKNVINHKISFNLYCCTFNNITIVFLPHLLFPFYCEAFPVGCPLGQNFFLKNAIKREFLGWAGVKNSKIF